MILQLIFIIKFVSPRDLKSFVKYALFLEKYLLFYNINIQYGV